MSSRRFVDLDGHVRRIDAKCLWFREADASHDICIPLSQVEEPDAVGEGQIGIRVTEWILSRLHDEGKR